MGDGADMAMDCVIDETRDEFDRLAKKTQEKSIMNIYQSIATIMQEVEPIAKARKNDQQNYKFRGIDDIYNELNPHLAKNGVFFCPEIVSKEREERTTKSGGALIYTVLVVKFTVYAQDGSHVDLVTVGEAMDSGDKSANKAMSAAYKYAMMQLFCIPTEDEKDTETQTHEVTPKKRDALDDAFTPAPEKEWRDCSTCKAQFEVNPKYPNARKCYPCAAAAKSASNMASG